jgi:hypothetical protein
MVSCHIIGFHEESWKKRTNVRNEKDSHCSEKKRFPASHFGVDVKRVMSTGEKDSGEFSVWHWLVRIT